MSQTATRKRVARKSVASRRVGYVVAVLVNAAMLYAVNRWPGWQEVPFLTKDTELVVGLVNATIVVNLVANLVYLARDPRWLKALGDVATTAVGLAAMVRIWKVFPLDVSDRWELLVRALLVLGIVGSAIAIVVGIVRFGRALSARSG
jgi:hypothetical protein